jgi:hypothetical protein
LAFFGVGLRINLGVLSGFGLGVAVVSGVGVGLGVVLGVGDGNSISLFAVVAAGFSSSASSSLARFGSVGGVECSGGGDLSFSDSPAPRSPALPNQTMLSALDDTLAARLQRINPAISTTCANAIKTMFRQKGFTTLNRKIAESLIVSPM